jgi:periplasmic protein TonB
VTRLSPEQADKLLVTRVEPQYPDAARKAHVSGIVHVELTTDRDGKVVEAKPLDGDPVLAAAAKEAVLQWRYKPTMLMGMAMPMNTTVAITFADPRRQAQQQLVAK